MTRDRSLATSTFTTVGPYATTHAAVDAVCALVLWRAVHAGLIAAGAAFTAFVVYNLLAFAVQPVIGLAVDRIGRPRDAAALGGLMVVVAVPLAAVPHLFVAAVVMAGLGNAVFHVGGGVVSAGIAPGRATPLGFFVAPGAAGLAWGIVSGRGGGAVWPAAAALAVFSLAILALPTPAQRTSRPLHASAARHALRPGSRLELIVILLAFVIGVRSYAGLALALPWKREMTLLIALTAAVVAGKAAGGVLADRFGWRLIGIGALVASLPLLALGGSSPAAGITGMLVFNMTMPVTLAAMIAALPRHVGFAFGLTCLALFIGAAPVLAGWAPPVSATVLTTLSAAAAVALWFGLGELRRTSPPPAEPSPSPDTIALAGLSGALATTTEGDLR
jgi:FSR family fosmidomycin resistance protein-like MFS transporter